MPAKRVSLKGQGADLFFGGKPPLQTEEQLPDQESTAMAPGADVPIATADVPLGPDGAHLPETDLPVTDPAPLADPAPVHELLSEGKQERYAASTLASNNDVIEAIRRVVKQTGREVSFVRLSAEEKGRLADIVYTYRRQGRKTTENELNRIAINALLDDYDAHGAQSVLARVLDALHA